MMVGCSQASSMTNNAGRVSDTAVLLWAVVEALEDVPATPDAQREYERGRAALSELLGRWTSDCENNELDILEGPPEERVVIELTATRNHRQQWSCHDLLRLQKLAGSVPPRTISARLGRTEQSVRSKASSEGISLKIHGEGPPGQYVEGSYR